MAITKSAKKALRQSQRRRVGNLALKNKMKSLVKEAKSLVSQKKIAEAEKLLPQVYEILDKAAKKGLIKKNTASRKKSRITRLVSKSRQ
ncbi:MAG: 30S ribosomal protein S20 [Candidatus Wildermuthbacteria bacterium]|nr:30S ribosomal protein S20 [Candidatus Wildermuthbacteria bacterium]